MPRYIGIGVAVFSSSNTYGDDHLYGSAEDNWTVVDALYFVLRGGDLQG